MKIGSYWTCLHDLELSILGLEDTYKLDLSSISDKVDFEVLIETSGYFTKYSVLWDVADSPASAFTDKISTSHLKSSISLEVQQFLKLNDPELFCQVAADGLGSVNKSMTIVAFREFRKRRDGNCSELINWIYWLIIMSCLSKLYIELVVIWVFLVERNSNFASKQSQHPHPKHLNVSGLLKIEN